MKERVTESECKQDLPSALFTPQKLTIARAGPGGQQGPKYLDHHLLSFQAHQQAAGREAEQPGLTLALGHRCEHPKQWLNLLHHYACPLFCQFYTGMGWWSLGFLVKTFSNHKHKSTLVCLNTENFKITKGSKPLKCTFSPRYSPQLPAQVPGSWSPGWPVPSPKQDT